MKLKNLLKLYKLSKDWEFIDGKLSIPQSILPDLDIRMDNVQLKDEYNPKANVRGVFMPDMTEADYALHLQQTSGWKKFYDKVKNVTNGNSTENRP
jgi:phosphate-selective porin